MEVASTPQAGLDILLPDLTLTFVSVLRRFPSLDFYRKNSLNVLAFRLPSEYLSAFLSFFPATTGMAWAHW